MRLGPDNFCFIQHTRDGDHIRDHINDTENPLLFGTFLSVAKKMPGGLCTLSKVMNQRGAASILSSKIELGGDASAAAGPKGRDASADSDLWMRAEILSYSRSRGLFAGISLEGSTLRPDIKANERIYGRKITAKAILLHNRVAVPVSGRHLARVLQAHAPRNESKQVVASR
jgi:hypothetical protein